jgi:hypothetical protein
LVAGAGVNAFWADAAAGTPANTAAAAAINLRQPDFIISNEF